MEMQRKRTLHEIDVTFNEYMEIATDIYISKTVGEDQKQKIHDFYDGLKQFDITNLSESINNIDSEIKTIKDEVHKFICSRQIKTIKDLKETLHAKEDTKHSYEKCIRILLILLRNKISLITTKKPLIPNKKYRINEKKPVKFIQTRIPKPHNQEIQEMQRLQDKFNQESRERRYKQIESDENFAQQLEQVYNMEQKQKQEEEDRDLALAYYYKDRPFASAITRLTRKQKPKPKRKTLIKPKKKTPKEDKKLEKLVKKHTQAKKRKKQRKEQDTKKNRILKKVRSIKNRQQ